MRHQDLQERHLEVHAPAPDQSAPHRGRTGQGVAADLPEWAAGLMLIMQPISRAAWCHRQSTSSRMGWR